MMEMEIQQATVTDAEELADVYRSAYQENRRLGFPTKAESATARTITEWIEDSQVYVAMIGDEIVGGVRLDVTDSDCVKLSRLGVHEDWKGEGIGGNLLDHAEELAREWSHTAVWLTTPEDHPYLPDLYRCRGYKKTKPYPLEYRDYDEIVMEKRVR